jgi:hypothetical protein
MGHIFWTLPSLLLILSMFSQNVCPSDSPPITLQKIQYFSCLVIQFLNELSNETNAISVQKSKLSKLRFDGFLSLLSPGFSTLSHPLFTHAFFEKRTVKGLACLTLQLLWMYRRRVIIAIYFCLLKKAIYVYITLMNL